MRVLILGLNYSPEMVGIAKYTTGLCEALVLAGHSVHAIVGNPYYPAWKVFKSYSGLWRSTHERGVRVTRCPHYVPSQPSGPKRIVHHLSFALSSFIPMLIAAFGSRPDVVISVAPSLLGTPVAKLSARVLGVKSWLHLQDFEVDAAIATGLMRKKSFAARIARAVERQLLTGFDQLSSISPEMCQRLAVYAGGSQVVEFRNWADIDREITSSMQSSFRSTFNIRTEHVALYSGNIANKQGIEIVLEAARLLRRRADLTFVICGEGPNRARLEADAADIGNVVFADLQPADQFKSLLALATVHLLPQKADAADLVLPSKLANMLASGRPVVATAAIGTGLFREVYGCGVVVPPGDTQAFAKAIEHLLDDENIRDTLGQSALSRAETVWSKERTLDGVVNHIVDLVGGSPDERRRHEAGRVRS